MSSSRKDARWALAKDHAKSLGLDYPDFTSEGWQKLLRFADAHLDLTPSSVEFWARKFNEDD